MTDQQVFGRRGRSAGSEPRVFRTEIAQPIEVVVKRGGVRWGRIVLIGFALCVAAGVIGNLTEGKPPLAIDEAHAVAAVKPVAAKKCGATLKEYTALQVGSTIGDAERIIGCKGSELSRVAYGGKESVMLSWPAETGFFSNMNATFLQGRLTAKAQLGLE